MSKEKEEPDKKRPRHEPTYQGPCPEGHGTVDEPTPSGRNLLYHVPFMKEKRRRDL